ncbi:hypothetical protein ElyMa_006054700 [Elysia marginata]|uniref:Uncharacterized protein n=1 Tax=Elysia marginata TaxID=1093978 RepID=A0AAV4GNC3_9GAST|nr:hypothetical protein ElyMa_006054700 [Elysia marginata]
MLYSPSTSFPFSTPWSVPGIFSSDEKRPASKDTFGRDSSAFEQFYKLKRYHKAERSLIKPEDERFLRGTAYEYLSNNIHSTALSSLSDMSAPYPASLKQQKGIQAISHAPFHQQHQHYINYCNQAQQILQQQQQQQNIEKVLIAPGANDNCGSQFNEGGIIQNPASEPSALLGEAFRNSSLFYPLTSQLYNQDAVNKIHLVEPIRLPLPLLPLHTTAYQPISLLPSPKETVDDSDRICQPQMLERTPNIDSEIRYYSTPPKSDNSQNLSKHIDSPGASSSMSSRSPSPKNSPTPLSPTDSPLS